MASDYDLGTVTDRERNAAKNQRAISKRNADAVKNQLTRQLANYDMANAQNRALADVQLKQNQRKTEADRFEAQRNLQNAATGLFGSMNQAMNGSTVGNTMRMLENRNDADNQNFWTQHQTNQNAVENAYQESFNQNQVAKNEALASAEKSIRDIEDDLAANLNNINPNLYVAPASTSNVRFNATELYNNNKVDQNNAALSGYLMPQNSVQAARNITKRNRLQGNDYYSRLINQFNGR